MFRYSRTTKMMPLEEISHRYEYLDESGKIIYRQFLPVEILPESIAYIRLA